MDRSTRLFLRLLAPGVGALVAACLLASASWNLGANPLLTGVASAWDWLVGAALLAAVALSAHGFYRFRQWERGRGPDCAYCSGLLGRERDGRYGAYRRCLACGKNCARIDYA